MGGKSADGKVVVWRRGSEQESPREMEGRNLEMGSEMVRGERRGGEKERMTETERVKIKRAHRAQWHKSLHRQKQLWRQ